MSHCAITAVKSFKMCHDRVTYGAVNITFIYTVSSIHIQKYFSSFSHRMLNGQSFEYKEASCIFTYCFSS